jgi:hypothetical protein
MGETAPGQTFRDRLGSIPSGAGQVPFLPVDHGARWAWRSRTLADCEVALRAGACATGDARNRRRP